MSNENSSEIGPKSRKPQYLKKSWTKWSLNAKWEVAGKLAGESSGECVLAGNRTFTKKCMNNGENVVERSVKDKEISIEFRAER